MNRRAVTIVLIAVGTIGSLSVLAQQNNQQPAVSPNNSLYNPSGNHHNSLDPFEAERDVVISQHLAVARAQLQEARREIDPSARIDRVITALEELIVGLEYADGVSVSANAGENEHHQAHGAPAALHSGGGCN